MESTADPKLRQSLNKTWIGLGLLLIAMLVTGGAYWLQRNALPRRLTEARVALGTVQGATLVKELAARYPNNAEVLLLQAQRQRLDGQNTQAMATLKRAADLDGPQALIERERLLNLAQEDFRSAEPRLQNILDADPFDREVRLALALGYNQLRYFERAEALVNPILEKNPEDGPAACMRGRIRMTQGFLDTAKPDLERAARLGQDQYYGPLARIMLASCLLDLGKFEDALRMFRECRKDTPDNGIVLLGLGRAARFLAGADPRNLEQAEEAFQTARRLRPNDVDVLLELSQVYEQRNELPKARAVLEEAEQRNPDRYEVYFRLAKVLRGLGEPERAAAYQKKYDLEKKRFTLLPKDKADNPARDEGKQPAAPPVRTNP